jgi:hypothetical protein
VLERRELAPPLAGMVTALGVSTAVRHNGFA